MPVKLTPRLATAPAYIRPGHLLADVGTDHAYLPIYLCQSGQLSPVLCANGETLAAIASDINRGPVERATLHIEAAGLADQIRAVQTDGLRGLDVYDPDDIIIFGMGGELIAAILSAAPWATRPGKRLILQPMTHADRLRAYLWNAGLDILAESLSREGDRIYQTLCVESLPAGIANTAPAPTPAEWMVGQARHHAADPQAAALHRLLIQKTLRTESAARDARRRAGQDTAEQDTCIASLEAMLQAYDTDGAAISPHI